MRSRFRGQELKDDNLFGFVLPFLILVSKFEMFVLPFLILVSKFETRIRKGRTNSKRLSSFNSCSRNLDLNSDVPPR